MRESAFWNPSRKSGVESGASTVQGNSPAADNDAPISPEEEKEFDEVAENLLRASKDTKHFIDKRSSRVLEAVGLRSFGSEYQGSSAQGSSQRDSILSFHGNSEIRDSFQPRPPTLYRNTIEPLQMAGPSRGSLDEIQDMFDTLEAEMGVKL
jgi:hypothetical protein